MRCSKARNTIQSFEPVSGSFLLCDQKLDVDRDMRKPRRVEPVRRDVEGQRRHGKEITRLRFAEHKCFGHAHAIDQAEMLAKMRNDRLMVEVGGAALAAEHLRVE